MTLGCRAVLPNVQVLYRADAPVRTESFGPYAIDIARDAPVAGERLPIVAISHGTGGTPWGYRGMATHLVEAGFAVALVEHVGNSRNDNSLANTPANLTARPRHVREALDAAAADPVLAAHVAADRAAVIGHSMGGYTALALAGGHPVVLPNETPDGRAHSIAVESDARVRAIVLLAPAIPWFMAPGALADVHVPMLVRTGEHDELVPPYFVEGILRGIASDYAVVPGAGHFAWFYPVPPALAGLPPAQDPAGFDRAAYQPTLHAELTRFLSSI